MPDALSRLASTALAAPHAELEFASAYTYTATLVEMSPEFKDRLLNSYKQDPTYCRIIKVIDRNDALPTADRTSLLFGREDSLIWHYSDTARLCIPESLVLDVLSIAHTEAGHPGAACTFKRAAASWYIRRLGRHVRTYLCHCPQCLVF